MLETLKPTIIPNRISELITELTELWLDWMKNHNFSNNSNNSMSQRRLGGERCEALQRRRQEILVEINQEFNNIL
jgi:hypothetical protein